MMYALAKMIFFVLLQYQDFYSSNTKKNPTKSLQNRQLQNPDTEKPRMRSIRTNGIDECICHHCVQNESNVNEMQKKCNLHKQKMRAVIQIHNFTNQLLSFQDKSPLHLLFNINLNLLHISPLSFYLKKKLFLLPWERI